MTAATALRRLAPIVVLSVPLAVVGIANTSVSAATTVLPVAPVGDCGEVDPAAVAVLPLHEVAGQLDDLSSFSAAITASDLGAVLAGPGPFTVFAPSNEAIAAIPTNVFDSILADTELLSSILGYHVVVGQALGPGQVGGTGDLQTLSGTLAIAIEGESLVLNGGEATVTCAGITTGNGVIYIIDAVLQPTAVAEPCPGASSSVPGSSMPASSMPPVSTVPASSVPGSSVPGSSVPPC